MVELNNKISDLHADDQNLLIISHICVLIIHLAELQAGLKTHAIFEVRTPTAFQGGICKGQGGNI